MAGAIASFPFHSHSPFCFFAGSSSTVTEMVVPQALVLDLLPSRFTLSPWALVPDLHGNGSLMCISRPGLSLPPRHVKLNMSKQNSLHLPPYKPALATLLLFSKFI